jgi:tetratricopeptide (TPR) repeat protein
MPEDPEVLGELDRLYDLMGRSRERVEILELLLRQAAPAERVELHRQVATLCAASLAAPERATPHLLRAYALAREVESQGGETTPQLTLLRELAETLRAAGRIDAWVRAAEVELQTLDADSSDDRRRIAGLRLELAAAYGRSLRLPDPARKHLLAVTAMPDAGSLLPPERMASAERALIDALRAERNHMALAERLVLQLERGSGDAADWCELARLYAESLHAPTAAADAYREALERRPDDLGAIRGLRHVAECLRDWSEVARSLELEIDALTQPSPHERATLHKKLGEIYWRRLEALDRAANAYTAGLEAMPGDVEAIRCLQSVQERRQAWAETADLYEREIELLGGEEAERRHGLWLSVARLARDELRDATRALRAYEAAALHGRLAAADQRSFAELYHEAGDLARYADTYSIWCDDPDGEASVWDHLSLVGALVELGRHDAALARALRASEVDPRNAEAWDRVAELHGELGNPVAARDALEQAAALHEPRPAGKRLVEAASLCRSSESEQAARLLRQAILRDPALVTAQADLAVIAERRGDLEEAESAAGHALDLISNNEGELTTARQLEIALVGGRCARSLHRFESATRFFAAALERDASCQEALEAQCEVLFAQGEWVVARNLADARLEMPGDNPGEARQLAISGRGLEATNDETEAVARYRQALGADAGLSLAHEGLVRIHEAAGHSERAIEALEQWIENESDPRLRATARLRIAGLQHEAGDDDVAERHLRAAVEDDAELEEAWGVLTELLAERERDDEALRIGERALASIETPAWRARVALAMGRILDGRRDSRRAIDAYAEAARGDTRCVEAALGQARLLRAAGEWRDSAEALGAFAQAHPDPDSLDLARVHLERGRLMAGPLEQVEEAIRCYERALELCPDLTDAREPLAALLAHAPERWHDAAASHRALLAEEPTRTASVRSLLEIAQRNGWEDATRFGLAVLRALGATTPEENSEAPHELPEALDAPEQLQDPVWETARRICRTGAQEIGAAIQGETGSREIEVGDGDIETHFRVRLVDADADLTAPGLADLSIEELSSVIYTVTALSVDPGGNCNDGPYRYELDAALGRWSRRKIRKALGAHSVRDIQAIDYEAWRDAVRLNAACIALDCGEGDLREALITLSGRDAEGAAEISDSADICALVAGSRMARRLLARVIDTWCARMLSAGR